MSDLRIVLEPPRPGAIRLAKRTTDYLERVLAWAKENLDSEEFAEIHAVARGHAGGKGKARRAQEAAQAESVSKPFPNEHAARQRDPGDFQPDSFRRKEIADGVTYILGRLKGETTMTLQSVRFAAATFTPAQARAWLKEHDLGADLEEATGEKARKMHFVKATMLQDITVVVMEPGRLDTEKEWATPETIYKAMHDFGEHPEFSIDHGRPESPAEKVPGWLVESFQTDADLAEFRGASFEPPLRKGAWIATWHMSDPAQWEKARTGGYSGASIEGHPEEGGGYRLVEGSRPPA